MSDPQQSKPLTGPEIYAKAKSDWKFYASACLSILNRATGQRGPFKPNPVQSFLRTIPARFKRVLKARKMGVSTDRIAYDIHKCAFEKDQHRLLICQDWDATSIQLKERVVPMIESSIIPLGAKITEDGVLFPSGSRYYVGTAGAKKFRRGSDVTGYHFTESAHWDDPEVITGIEEACLEGADGIDETTANGQNHFYASWMRGQRGEGRYKNIFLPWFMDPQYRIPGGLLDMPTEQDKRLIEAYGLDHEQLAWARQKRNDMSDPTLFVQEYPATWQEAFISSGRMVFDWVALTQHERRCVDPAWRGYLADKGESIALEPKEDGRLSVWEGPIPRHVYVIGADVAEGNNGETADYSTAFVLDVGSSRQVAEWHGHIEPDKFADVLVKLALFYNSAMLAPESWPGLGGITMSHIAALGYGNVYRSNVKHGTTGDNRDGWATTSATREPMLMALAGQAVRDVGMVIQSKGLIDEMRSFVWMENGKMDHNPGCYSDRIFAAGIAWYVSREIAAHTQYAKPKLKEIEQAINRSGGASVPQWKGGRYGVRPE